MQESLVVLGFMVTLHCNDPVQAPISVFYLIFIHVRFEFTFIELTRSNIFSLNFTHDIMAI